MSKDEQVRTWDYFGDNSKNFSDRLNRPVTPSFDFAQGPVTKDQLLEWVDHPDYACPDVVQFDYQRVTKLISTCLASREKVSHLGLPPVFWRLLDENLVKAENLWGFALSDYIGWKNQGLSESPNQRESVFTTATQLHILFSHWYAKHGDSLNGTGEVIWDEVLSEVKFSQGRLDRIRVSFEGVEQPFFLWEVDYPSAERPGFTITIQSPEIAAWFVLFSLHKAFRLFGLLVADVLRGTSEGDDADLRHYLFEYWADIQAVMAVAQYWYDRIYSLNETLTEFRKRVSSEAETMTLEELKKPDAPLLHVGRLRLFNWFKNLSSGEAAFSQWQAFWMAKNGQLEPPNDTEWDPEGVRFVVSELHCSFQIAVMKLAFEKAITDFRTGHPYEKDLLLILDRKHSKPKAKDVEDLVFLLIGNEDGSSKTSFIRSRQAVADYREKVDSFRREFPKMLQGNTAKVRKKFIAG